MFDCQIAAWALNAAVTFAPYVYSLHWSIYYPVAYMAEGYNWLYGTVYILQNNPLRDVQVWRILLYIALLAAGFPGQRPENIVG